MLKRLQHIWKQSFDDWNYIFIHELRTIFRDPGVLIFCLLLPLFYPLVYTWIYNNEVVNEVPIAVVDNSHTAQSRDYLRKLDATPEVKIVSYAPDMETARQLVKHRKVYGIVYMPESFSRDIVRGERTHISVFVDMSGLLYYKALVLANSNVSLAMNADIRASRNPSLAGEQLELEKQRINYDQVDIFNSQVGFASFLIPGVLVLILQQALILGIALAAGTARERNTYRELMPINRHYNGLLRIVLGKALAYFMVFIPQLVYVLGVVPHLFHLPQLGNELEIAMVMIPFIIAVIFCGMTFSVLVRKRETCFMIIVFTSVPLLFMSGISWPAPSIPTFWKYVSYISPSTFGINAYIKLNSLGADFSDVSMEWHALCVQCIVYLATTLLVYRNNMNGSKMRYSILHHKLKLRRKKKQKAQIEQS